MNDHPHLKKLYTLFTEEVQPFRKVHRLIDLFESIIKTHTVVILAEYFRHNKVSDTAKGLLSQGLRTPSLGTWQLFSRVLFEELQFSSKTKAYFCPNASYYSQRERWLKVQRMNFGSDSLSVHP
jgi:hypothetical protein